MPRKRRICFVTGTRAEFGLMIRTLRAIKSHPKLELSILATGMHLSGAHGRSLREIRRAGFSKVSAIPWSSRDTSPNAVAVSTGKAVCDLARVFMKNKPDVVLVVGDRVEAFAAASAAHIGGIPLAHVHGGDRALGQVDDSLRHAITKLAHIHFPATRASARRIHLLGEETWRIHRVGSPGLDGIRDDAMDPTDVPWRKYALLILHPTDADDAMEARRTRLLLNALIRSGLPNVVVIHPNNDPGSEGIARVWQQVNGRRVQVHRNLSRGRFLGYLKDAAMLVGNSSSGIIEAASFGTPVLDIGPRQAGRERGDNVAHADWNSDAIARAIRRIWNDGNPRRFPARNIYGSGNAAEKIAHVLASIQLDARLRRKLIRY